MDRKQKVLALSSCMDLLLIRTSQEIKLRMIADCFDVFLIFAVVQLRKPQLSRVQALIAIVRNYPQSAQCHLHRESYPTAPR